MQGVARAFAHFLAACEPAVGDLSHAVVVFEVIAGGQGLAHFGVACDGDAANGFVVGGGRLRRRGLSVVGNFRRFRAFYGFCGTFAVGVFGFDGYRLAFVRVLQGVARALPHFFAVSKPAVGDCSHPVFVFEVVAGFQCLAHFRLAADFDGALRFVVARLRVGVGVGVGRSAVDDFRRFRAFYGFCGAFAVGVFGFDGYRLAFVRVLQGVARALPYFLSACEPAVGDGAESVVVFNVVAGGQGFAHFRLARDGDFACRLVVERADGRDVRLRVAYLCGRRAGEGFVMTQVVFVFDVYGQGFAFVARLDGVARAGRAGDGVAVGKPLVFDVLRLHAICVFDFGEQGLSDFGRADEFDFAFLVVGGVGVVDGDFGAVVAGVAVAVVQDVFDRIGVAVFEFFVRGEGDVAATAHGPHALFFNDKAGDGVFVFVQ